mmetsp:Transcript_20496/g.61277  ORF Transcript_20496/g.61277 Transcript_20496/m.61277 type:complete len:215 (+) Transcript_20496:495-1139(+)
MKDDSRSVGMVLVKAVALVRAPLVPAASTRSRPYEHRSSSFLQRWKAGAILSKYVAKSQDQRARCSTRSSHLAMKYAQAAATQRPVPRWLWTRTASPAQSASSINATICSATTCGSNGRRPHVQAAPPLSSRRGGGGGGGATRLLARNDAPTRLRGISTSWVPRPIPHGLAHVIMPRTKASRRRRFASPPGRRRSAARRARRTAGSPARRPRKT